MVVLPLESRPIWRIINWGSKLLVTKRTFESCVELSEVVTFCVGTELVWGSGEELGDGGDTPSPEIVPCNHAKP